MARIDCPPMRRAKILCARSRLGCGTDWLGGRGHGLLFCDTVLFADILEFGKALSKNLEGA
jgi:hypothetical protein